MYESWYIDRAHQGEPEGNLVERISSILENQELTTDTCDFLKSLIEYHQKHKGLTANQFKALEEVERGLTPTGLAEKKVWKDSYDAEKRRIAAICASYYVNTKYFTDVSKKILEDKSYVLSEKTYVSMCENEYARKILRETDAEPKYKIGTLVKFRKTYSEDPAVCSVIGVNVSPVTSAARGAKKYSVLPFGSSTPITVEERNIKRYKKKMEAT
tara:strand:- start:91 stop:732 length:642 start_codon:yes stop_codon:yes gene_type:complete